ncbi:MAG TPA: hypothetical protein VHQ47_06555, partial [Phycisphaerae bacterium]|nr:hypothetical protein [Phycisphaerae bacterium]
MPDKLPPQPDPLAPHFAALRENLPHSPLLDPTFTHRLANTTIRPKPLIPIHPALISIVILI